LASPFHSGAIFALCGALLVALLSPAAAQDIRGWKSAPPKGRWSVVPDACRQCEFFSSADQAGARDTGQDRRRQSRSRRCRAEIAALKSTMAELNSALAQMKAKVEPSGKK